MVMKIMIFEEDKLTKEEQTVMTLIEYHALHVGNVVPLKMIKEDAERLELPNLSRHIMELKKHGLIYEVREGFLQII